MCQTFASTQTFQATQALMDEPLTKQYMQAQERPKRLQKPNFFPLARSPCLAGVGGHRVLPQTSQQTATSWARKICVAYF
jgi:hypothetical protein